MIERDLKDIITGRLKNFPAVALLGSRQSGKTTLAKTLSKAYYDLELEEERLRLDIQWNNIISSKEMVILDEAQYYPDIFPRIRYAIDADRRRNGRFLLLGSVSPGLMQEVSESLAGRIALCELSPLSLMEVRQNLDDNLWLMGGYPDGGIHRKESYLVWQKSYLDLLAMRDLPAWGLPAKPAATQRFFNMLAVSHGNIWNASQTGKSLGVSYHTANSYLDYLEQAYLVRRITPYYGNLKKRLTKSPKIYWRDSGLLHSLLRVRSFDELLSQPWVGLSWEGWVMEQILIFLNNSGIEYDGPYYLRTNNGDEIDLILSLSGVFYSIEIKLTTLPTQSDMFRLQKVADLIGETVKVLISRTSNHIENENLISTNTRMFLKYLDKKFK